MNIYNMGNFMVVYLATPHTMRNLMDIYLAAPNTGSTKALIKNIDERLCILESFIYVQDWMIPYIRHKWDFLLDSGAFTFMSQTKKEVDWYDYVARYAEYIKDHNIEKFFELDIDSVTGLKYVEQLRKKIESLTGRPSIPVWHKSRGKDYFIGLVKDYDYVSIGGIVTKEIKPEEYKFFPWFINKAHENGCRIHGLGFTRLGLLEQYSFDSVDSTAWIYGNRGGFVQYFDGRSLQNVSAKKDQRLKNSRAVAEHNFIEWVKFQKYAKKYL